MRYAVVAAVAVAAAAGWGAAAQTAAEERCYGIAPAGENDGLDGAEAPGTATVDWQGNAWIWVEAGTCLRRAAPPQPDGTPRRGSIEPLARDRPS